MTEVIGQAFVRIRALGDKLDSDIDGQLVPAAKRASAKAEKEIADGIGDGAREGSKRAGKSLDDVGGSLQKFGAKATTFISLPLAAALGGAAKSASDLNESVNVTNITFGKAKGSIEAFVKSSAGIGLSERAARDATAQIGGLLLNMGYLPEAAAKASIDLTKLSSDLGSAFNKEPAEAASAIAAAIRGEGEEIRRFNITLDDQTIRQKAVALGLADTTAEVDKNGKAQATLAIITEQSKLVQGDFANTADGVANAQRILRAETENAAASLGQSLLPALKTGIGLAQGAIDGFSNLSPEMQKVGLGFAAIAAAAGPVAGVVGTATSVLGKFKSEQGGLNTKALAGAGAFAVLAIGVATVTAALAKAKEEARETVEALGKNVDPSNFNELEGNYERVNAKLKATRGEFSDLKRENGGGTGFFGNLGVTTQDFIEVLSPLPNKVSNVREEQAALKKENDRLVTSLNTAETAIAAFAQATGLTREEARKLATVNKIDLTGSYGDITNGLFAANAATKTATGASTDLAEAQGTLTDKTASAEDKLKAFKSALDSALGATLSVSEASIAHQNNLDKLRKAITDNGASLDITNPKHRETASAFNDVVKSANDEVEALVKSGKIAEGSAEQQGALTQRLNDLKQKFPELKGPIDEYIKKIEAIPPSAGTTVSVDTAAAERALARLKALIRSLPKSTTFATNIDPNALINEAFDGREHGGPVRKGQPYIVGEKRAELFVPDSNGTILPHVPQSRSGGPALYIDKFYATEEADVDAVLRRTEFLVQAGRL